MNFPYTLGDFYSDLSVFPVRIDEIDPLPVQLVMATDDVHCRILKECVRTGTTAILKTRHAFQTVQGKLGFGEKVTFHLRDSYGDTCKVILRREDEQPNDGTDGLRFEYDAMFFEMFQLDD